MGKDTTNPGGWTDPMLPEEDPVDVLAEGMRKGLEAVEAVGLAMLRRAEEAGLEALDRVGKRLRKR